MSDMPRASLVRCWERRPYFLALLDQGGVKLGIQFSLVRPDGRGGPEVVFLHEDPEIVHGRPGVFIDLPERLFDGVSLEESRRGSQLLHSILGLEVVSFPARRG